MLVVATCVLGLVLPGLGAAAAGAVTPVLAVLMLAVSLSFDLDALRECSVDRS